MWRCGQCGGANPLRSPGKNKGLVMVNPIVNIGYLPAIKRGNWKSPMNGGFWLGKHRTQWWIVITCHYHVWLPECSLESVGLCNHGNPAAKRSVRSVSCHEHLTRQQVEGIQIDGIVWRKAMLCNKDYIKQCFWVFDFLSFSGLAWEHVYEERPLEWNYKTSWNPSVQLDDLTICDP